MSTRTGITYIRGDATSPHGKGPPIRYDALGTGLAGGTWDRVEPLSTAG